DSKGSDKVAIRSIFTYHSPLIASIKKIGKINQKVRRAKLYYLERELAKKKDNELLLETNQAKKKIISQVITSKSDIIVSFDEEYLDPVISQKKTYDFRIEYPNQISNDNVYNELFNQGK
ncbi:4214_t:CDS:2, partial [Entrophospora sp. SA101]